MILLEQLIKNYLMTILTTHVGSLPRSKNCPNFYLKENNEIYDEDTFNKVVKDSVFDIVKKQKEVGIDIISDGDVKYLMQPM